MLNTAQVSAVMAACCLASTASAQSAAPTDMAPPPAFHGVWSQAGYRTVGALSGDWQVVDIFAVPNQAVRLPNGRPWIEYAARRSAGAGGTEGATTWASSRDCPALYNTLVWMAALVAPRIEIGGVSPGEAEPTGRRPLAMTLDGASTTVWGRGTQPDHSLNARVEMSSNGGLIAEFGRAATENLATCWRDEPPVFGPDPSRF